MFLVSSFNCLCPIYWSHVLSREWRCSWSSADRRCSNYIWAINNLIANLGAPYIRDLTVVKSGFMGNVTVGEASFQNTQRRCWYDDHIAEVHMHSWQLQRNTPRQRKQGYIYCALNHHKFAQTKQQHKWCIQLSWLISHDSSFRVVILFRSWTRYGYSSFFRCMMIKLEFTHVSLRYENAVS